MGCSRAETLASSTRPRPASSEYRPRVGVGKRDAGAAGRMTGTLLGPEGTTRPGREAGPGVVVSVLPGMIWGHTGWSRVGLVSGVSWWVVGWLWVENCTVDASILFSVVCVVWLSCQGRTVDALAPGADEGRGRPR